MAIAAPKKNTTKKKSTRKASPVKKKVVLNFVPDEKKPDTKPDDPTKGALRFSEADNEGNVLDVDHQVVGTLYVRKSQISKLGGVPTSLSVTIDPS